MQFEYLIRVEGVIADTIQSKIDLELSVGAGIVLAREYHTIEAISFFVDFDQNKKVYIVDILHIPFENAPATIRKKMEWDQGFK